MVTNILQEEASFHKYQSDSITGALRGSHPLEAFFQNPPAELLERLEISETGAGPDEESSAAAQLERQEVGLITSAFHMPRAQRLAAARKLDFTPLPCSYRTRSGSRNFSSRDLIPDAGAVENISVALKERIARLAGR